jgi:transposase
VFRHHVQPRKTAWGVRRLLHLLMRRVRKTGRRIFLVMDQGSPHQAGSLRNDLKRFRPWIRAFWLPTYSPELNRIEMLWRYLKRQIANVLFVNYDQFAGHVNWLLDQIRANPDFTCSIVMRKQNDLIRRILVGAT